MAVAQPVPTPAELEPAPPMLGDCPRCSAEVLIVELADGRDVVLDPAEVLARFRCPDCDQVAARGHVRSGCLRCRLTGWIGERLPDVGAVRVDALGVGRHYRGRRTVGDAIHRVHVCGRA